jgi:hypothetical protein
MITKNIPIVILLVMVTSPVWAQSSDWIYVGQTVKYDIYYLKNSITRGTYTYVTVAAKFRNKETDSDGKEYKYASAILAYYKSAWNDLRCIIANMRYYYTDNDYRKGTEPKKEYIVTNNKILNDIYEKIK